MMSRPGALRAMLIAPVTLIITLFFLAHLPVLINKPNTTSSPTEEVTSSLYRDGSCGPKSSALACLARTNWYGTSRLDDEVEKFGLVRTVPNRDQNRDVIYEILAATSDERSCLGNHSVTYRFGGQDESNGLYAIVKATDYCSLSQEDWVQVDAVPLEKKAPEVNEEVVFSVIRPGTVEISVPCLNYGGTYQLVTSSKYLGTTHCSTKYFSRGPLRIPIGVLTVQLDCNTGTDLSNRTHVRPNIMPFGLGYYSHGYSQWHSLSSTVETSSVQSDLSHLTTSQLIVILHLVGDSTTEAVFKSLRKSCSTKVVELGCMRMPLRKKRPCQSYYRNCSNNNPAVIRSISLEVAFTFVTEPFGWSRQYAKHFSPDTPWDSASLEEAISFSGLLMKNATNSKKISTRQVVFFNYGLHAVPANFPFAFEHALTTLKEKLNQVASIVSVATVPTNPNRTSYTFHNCLTEPNVRSMRKVAECISFRVGVPFFDRSMMQFGQWSAYRDQVHVSEKHHLSEFIAHEFVKAALWVTTQK